jgi:hypothetical protein
VYIIAPAATVGAADAVDTQDVPSLVSRLPEDPGATNVGADVPLPKMTLLAVRVVRLVPPCAIDNGVVSPDRLVMFEFAPAVAYPAAGRYVATHADPVYVLISLDVVFQYKSPAVIAAPRGSSVGFVDNGP